MMQELSGLMGGKVCCSNGDSSCSVELVLVDVGVVTAGDTFKDNCPEPNGGHTVDRKKARKEREERHATDALTKCSNIPSFKRGSIERFFWSFQDCGLLDNKETSGS